MSLVVVLGVVLIGCDASVCFIYHAALAGYMSLMKESFAVSAGLVDPGKGAERLLVSKSLGPLSRLCEIGLFRAFAHVKECDGRRPVGAVQAEVWSLDDDLLCLRRTRSGGVYPKNQLLLVILQLFKIDILLDQV
jgi:hypothetical protein